VYLRSSATCAAARLAQDCGQADCCAGDEQQSESRDQQSAPGRPPPGAGVAGARGGEVRLQVEPAAVAGLPVGSISGRHKCVQAAGDGGDICLNGGEAAL
jgi:hypothetical protein